MRTTLPDEQGWYWCHLIDDDTWMMGFIDTCDEALLLFDPGPPSGGPCSYPLDGDDIKSELGDIEWHGPITCPGGDFGSETILASDLLHKEARNEKKVIAITHTDFRYCRDEGHGSSLTITRLLTRDEADALIKAELPGEA